MFPLADISVGTSSVGGLLVLILVILGIIYVAKRL